jgi:hypothetical protein
MNVVIYSQDVSNSERMILQSAIPPQANHNVDHLRITGAVALCVAALNFTPLSRMDLHNSSSLSWTDRRVRAIVATVSSK